MQNSTSIKIPKKYEHMIDEVYHDSDGYWVILNKGFHDPQWDVHSIHEDTQKEVLGKIRDIEPCSCEECKNK